MRGQARRQTRWLEEQTQPRSPAARRGGWADPASRGRSWLRLYHASANEEVGDGESDRRAKCNEFDARAIREQPDYRCGAEDSDDGAAGRAEGAGHSFAGVAKA